MAVPYTFGSATTSIPLSQLDSNFATTITLGNTAVQLGNTITNLTGVSNVASATSLSLGSNGNTTAITVDTSQNVGIGTTSPGYKLDVSGAIRSNVSGGTPAIYFGDGTYQTSITGQSNSIRFIGDAGAERMRIDTSGNLLVGTTSAFSGGSKLMVSASSTSTNPLVLQDTGTNYSTGNFFAYFINSTNGNSGSIAHTGATTVAYQTSSDQRLKENIVNAPSALSSLESMKVRSYDWKEDKKHVTYGFVAQEIKEYAPEIVAIGDDNETITDPRGTWGVEYGRLTPMLVKAIQEQQALITAQAETINALTARIVALEAK